MIVQQSPHGTPCKVVERRHRRAASLVSRCFSTGFNKKKKKNALKRCLQTIIHPRNVPPLLSLITAIGCTVGQVVPPTSCVKASSIEDTIASCRHPQQHELGNLPVLFSRAAHRLTAMSSRKFYSFRLRPKQTFPRLMANHSTFSLKLNEHMAENFRMYMQIEPKADYSNAKYSDTNRKFGTCTERRHSPPQLRSLAA